MFQLQIDDKTVDSIAEKIAIKAFEKFSKKMEMHTDLPPLLSREQLKEFLGIKDNKASELLARKDFPVLREVGRPKIPTKQLLLWIDNNTEWITENTPDMKFPYQIV